MVECFSLLLATGKWKQLVCGDIWHPKKNLDAYLVNKFENKHLLAISKSDAVNIS